MKKLPKISKNLRNFILGEDAKIIDKTVVKIALSASLGAFIITGVYAGGSPPANYYTHTNHLAIENGSSSSGATVHTNPNFANENSNFYKTSIDANGKTLNIDVAPKSVQTNHANHYNHTNGSSGKS